MTDATVDSCSSATSGAVQPSTSRKISTALATRQQRFGSIDPFLMTATMIVCFVTAADEHGGAATLTFAGAGCFTVMLGMTLALNMPINFAILRWDVERGDQERWRWLRQRGDRIHTARVLLDSAGFGLVAGAVVWH